MTVRFVSCDFCQRIADFQTMHMCPFCRKTVCRLCKAEGPLRPGYCARKTPCEGQPALPAPGRNDE